MKLASFALLYILSAALIISCVKNEAMAKIIECQATGDGRLSLYNYHLNERMDATYKRKGVYDQEVIEKIFKVLRSPDEETHPISIQLLEIIDNIQDHFSARTVEVISGFRSRAYNKGLKEEGRRVARESLHLEGRAADIHIDEVTEAALKDYAEGLKCGGVGFYPDNDFVHIDVGPVRSWGAKSAVRKLIGLENNHSLNTLLTDKNDYLGADDIQMTFTNRSSSTLRIESCANVEMFDKGEWKELGKIALDLRGDTVQPANDIKMKLSTQPTKCLSEKKFELPYARFRLRLQTRMDEASEQTLSNEFYIKRL